MSQKRSKQIRRNVRKLTREVSTHYMTELTTAPFPQRVGFAARILAGGRRIPALLLLALCAWGFYAAASGIASLIG